MNDRIVPADEWTSASEILDVVEREREGRKDIAYLHPHQATCTLPHTNPKSLPFTRSVPWLTLHLSSSIRGVGVPYGGIARLLLAHLMTTVVQTKSPVVEMSSSLRGLARTLQISDDGRSLGRLRDQLDRMLAATWAVEVEDKLPNGQVRKRTEKWFLAKGGSYIYDPRSPDQLSLQRPTIELSDEFAQAIMSRRFPLDLQAYRELLQSPLAMDIFAWASWRSLGLQEATDFPYAWLMGQFGGAYDPASKNDRKNFKRELNQAALKVLKVWPDFRVEKIRGGWRIRQSKPLVEPKTITITSG